MDIEKILKELEPEERVSLLSGVNSWGTAAVPRLHIPPIIITDGPHGVRKTKTDGGSFDIGNNEPSTAFPTAAAIASSWNTDNAYKMGVAIAKECRLLGVNVLLAPGVNIKRSPLCGRNFEYYSEDPLLTGKFAAAFIKGVQSLGVACCIKHFAANSNEDFRFYGDSIVDERTLREIYLRAFEIAVKDAKPYALMCSYNSVNGVLMSENKLLLTDVLRGEWGFDGLVMTDWGAIRDKVKGVIAGCDLEMPGDVTYNKTRLLNAMKNDTEVSKSVETSVRRVLSLVDKTFNSAHTCESDLKDHLTLATEIAADCAVLMKNDGTLPLSGSEIIFIVGEMFEKMRFQGAGSSLITPTKLISPKNAFDAHGVQYEYSKDSVPEKISADVILFFGGLTDFEESEGFDRKNMKLSAKQTSLIKALLRTGKKVVFILFAGSPVELPFANLLSAILNMYLPGMCGGEAVYKLVYAEVNPSGKLAESWPRSSKDSSCAEDFGKGPVSNYYEKSEVGYRYFDKHPEKLTFPFGHGLSYTTFSQKIIEKTDNSVTFSVSNTGSCDGAEVVQYYETIDGIRNLLAFEKVYLKAGETKTIELAFERPDYTGYSTQIDFKPQPIADTITLESPLKDFKKTISGKLLYNLVLATVRKDYKKARKLPDSPQRDAKLKNAHFVLKMMPNSSLRGLAMSSGGKFTYEMACAFVEIANGHIAKGLALMRKPRPA
ncbi:MAG: beta-glucosidase [Lachnospiraceae bacterium]|jgi:beta-glucosidase|nr:beta-glucosidase [Lachnospiraceae bacterium]